MAAARKAPGICTVLVFAVGASACAARDSSPALRVPSPFPNPSSPTSLKPDLPGDPIILPAAVLRTALSLEGVPYQWGGDSPSTGFDCSGFVRYVLAQHRIAAPRTSAEQFQLGARVDLKHLRAGDLVFFSTIAPGASHVGLAISNEEFVHAPASTGVVRVESVRSQYWQSRYVGARRIF